MTSIVIKVLTPELVSTVKGEKTVSIHNVSLDEPFDLTKPFDLSTTEELNVDELTFFAVRALFKDDHLNQLKVLKFVKNLQHKKYPIVCRDMVFPNLVELHVSSCNDTEMFSPCVMGMYSKYPSLETVKFDCEPRGFNYVKFKNMIVKGYGCDVYNNYIETLVASMGHAYIHGSKLKSIDLGRCLTEMHDLERFPDLEKLVLQNCGLGWNSIFAHGNALKELTLTCNHCPLNSTMTSHIMRLPLLCDFTVNTLPGFLPRNFRSIKVEKVTMIVDLKSIEDEHKIKYIGKISEIPDTNEEYEEYNEYDENSDPVDIPKKLKEPWYIPENVTHLIVRSVTKDQVTLDLGNPDTIVVFE